MSNQEQDFIAEIQKDFLEETSFLLDQCEESYLNLERPENRTEELAKIFRLAHSMKGAGASVGFTDLSKLAHEVEDCLTILRVSPHLVDASVISLLLRCGDALKNRVKMLKEKSSVSWDVESLKVEIRAMTKHLSGGTAEVPEPEKKPVAVVQKEETGGAAASTIKSQQSTSVKVDTDRIDGVLNIVGELVVLKSQLINETKEYHTNLKLNALVSLMEKSIRELQDKSLGMRMTPLKSLFLKTQRVVRDLSVKLGKAVDFEMIGEDTEIDRTMVELLSDPLLHIARNALDHGIEKTENRKKNGKPEKGALKMSAQQMGGRIVMKLSDDGAGIDRARVLKKASDKGLIPATQNPESLPDQDVYQFLFAPGFSTAEQISDVSGRGVGMDVVKTNIEKLKGTIEVQSTPGQGSSFIISIPLTTSITDGMQVKSGGQPYILPLDGIRELVDLNSEDLTRTFEGNEVLNVRGKLLPILHLGKLLKRTLKTEKENSTGTVVVVESARGLIALKVEAVMGQVQVVLKSLGEYFPEENGIAGAAILGDGKVALVLDIDHLKTGELSA